MRVRFAPSPTGYLHVGNARTALFNWLLARGRGGTFVLRLEDTDDARSTEASASGILDDLRWLGLDWDEGPDKGGPFGPYRQTQRLGRYRAHAEGLLASGHAYHCFCSPADLEAARAADLAAGRTPKYPGTCRGLEPEVVRARLANGEQAAIRFDVQQAPGSEAGAVVFEDLVRGVISTDLSTIGDFVLIRQNGIPAYNFAVVVDDLEMQITLVVRGEDHVPNTPRQILLYRALGVDAPQFAHLSLVLGPDHAPLSKRHGASSVADFRARGVLPEALRNYLALLGWSPGNDEEIVPVDELARRFRVEDVTKHAGVFDPEKLAWMNRHYLKVAEPSRLAALLTTPLVAAGRWPAELSADGEGRDFLLACVPLIAGTIDQLADAPERLRSVFDAPDPARVRAWLQEEGAEAATTGSAVIVAMAQELSARPRLTTATFREAAQQVRQRTGAKGRALFHPIRLALTGADSGPELDLLVPAIEAGAELPASTGVVIAGCRERVSACAAALVEA